MEKYGKDKQGGCAKAQDFWPPALHCNSWPKGHKVEISTASLDLDMSVLPYLLTCILVLSLHTFYLIDIQNHLDNQLAVSKHN